MHMSEETDGGAAARPASGAKPRSRRPAKAVTGTADSAALSPSTAPAVPAASGGQERGDADGTGAQQITANNVSINQGGAAEVEAESINVVQGGIGAASAEDITISMGGIVHAQADDIAVRMGGIGMARGERVSVELGAVGFAAANQVSVTQGFARAVLARDVHIRQGAAQAVVAQKVTFEGEGGAFLLLARNVEGNVRTVLDWRGAIAAGAALGLVLGLLSRRKRS
jgi:hypothetical protein